MSIWTYVQGVITLSASPIKEKLNKDSTYKIASEKDQDKYGRRFVSYIPYPEEQISFKNPHIVMNHDNPEKPIMCYDANVISYPVIKRTIDKNINILPNGEASCVTYFVNYNKKDWTSSTSCVECKDVEKAFKAMILETSAIYENITWKDQMDYAPAEVRWTNYNEESTLTLNDAIRYCEAADFYEKLIQFLDALVKDDIILETGFIRFYQDFCNENYLIEIDHDTITVIKDNDFEHKEIWKVVTEDFDDKPAKSVLRKIKIV